MEKTITAISVQKRNPRRVNVDLDGEYAFGLSRFVAAWLKVGEQISDKRISELLYQDQSEITLQKALSLLNYAPRTENEIRKKLSEKKVESELIEKTIIHLKKAGMVNDPDYAKSWIENRNQSHPRSQRMMRFELKRKGVSEDVIDHVLQSSATDEDLAQRAAVEYARRLTGADWIEYRKRLSAFLARRGFSYGTIAPVVRSLWEERNRFAGNQIENEEYEK